MVGNYLIVSLSPKLCVLDTQSLHQSCVKKKHETSNNIWCKNINKNVLIVIFHQEINNYVWRYKAAFNLYFSYPHILLFKSYLLATFPMAHFQFQCWHTPAANKTTCTVHTLAETWSITAHLTDSNWQPCQYLASKTDIKSKRPTSFLKTGKFNRYQIN